jgi:hypothetical protein
MAGFQKVSGLWKAEDKNGDLYYRGKGEDGKMYYMRPNTKKTKDTQPDMELSYQIFDDDKPQAPKPAGVQPVQAVQPVAEETVVDDDNDVPF